jgi:glyoxylase-like metal-dependent hydrolase (beta-lactamase superfamily II)
VESASAAARELRPGVWRLRLPMPWESVSHVNAYAIAGADGKVLLIDCGTAGDPTTAAALEHALGQAGFALEDVELLVATHVHSDHVGLAAHVVQRSGAPLWAHPDDGHAYDPLRAPDATAARRAADARLAGVPEERVAAFADLREESEGIMEALVPDRAVADGDVVPSGIGPWTVLATPGHAPSHIALIQREHEIAIVGDLLCNVFAPSFDVGYSPDPVGETLASLDRLEAEAPLELVLHGHGRPITDFAHVLELTRDGHRDRLKTVLDAVAAGPTTAYALAERVFGAEDDFFAVVHTHELHAYLHHLCHRGDLIATTTASGQVSYQRAAVPERSAAAR